MRLFGSDTHIPALRTPPGGKRADAKIERPVKYSYTARILCLLACSSLGSTWGCAGSQSAALLEDSAEIEDLRLQVRELSHRVVLLEEEKRDLEGELRRRESVAGTSPEQPSTREGSAQLEVEAGLAAADSSGGDASRPPELPIVRLAPTEAPSAALSAGPPGAGPAEPDAPVLLSGNADAKDFDLGRAALERGEAYQAETLFSRFIRQNPRHPFTDDALFFRAEARFARKSLSEAERDYLAVVEQYPEELTTPDAWLRLGEVRLELGNEPGARQAFAELQREHPHSLAAARIPRGHLK